MGGAKGYSENPFLTHLIHFLRWGIDGAEIDLFRLSIARGILHGGISSARTLDERMRIALAADHAGYLLKDELAAWLSEQGHEVSDLGTNGPESVDYPRFGQALAAEIEGHRAPRRTPGGRLYRIAELVLVWDGGPDRSDEVIRARA